MTDRLSPWNRSERIDVVHLFPEERARLLELLDSLSDEQWSRPTVCAGWDAKDVAAHLVGDDVGRLSRERDGHTVSLIGPEASWDELVARLNDHNEAWVRAMRRLSPRIIIGWLRDSGAQTQAWFESRDLDAIRMPVSWAGPEPAPVWLDLAREYTERWHHQQQIRDAVGAPALAEPRLFAPVLATFVRALPHTFRDVAAPVGTQVVLRITGDAGGAWSLVREDSGDAHRKEAKGAKVSWGLYDGVGDAPAASVGLDQDVAWRLFTKGIDARLGARARRACRRRRACGACAGCGGGSSHR